MSSAIKYIGIAIGAGILLLFGFLILSTLLIGYEIFGASNIEYYRSKFLLVAAVEVDGVVKTGSGVYEISYNRRTHGGGQGLQISPINGVKGKLPTIDLGKHGYLVFSFQYTSNYGENLSQTSFQNKGLCSETTVKQVPTSLMIGQANSELKIRDRIDLLRLVEVEKLIDFGEYTLPVYIAKKNADYSHLNEIAFCDIGSLLGSNIKPLSLKIKKINDEGKIKYQAPPAWVDKLVGPVYQRSEFK